MVKNAGNYRLFSASSYAETLLWQKQLIPATFYLKNISLLIISATLLYLSTIPSCMSAVGEETSKPEPSYCLRWKLYSYSSSSHLTPEKPFFIWFLSFFRFRFLAYFWPLLTTTANLPGLTHWNLSKKYYPSHPK